jgi:hypothetical protein
MRTTYTERLDNTIISVYNYTRKIAILLSQSDAATSIWLWGVLELVALILPARCFFIKYYVNIISQVIVYVNTKSANFEKNIVPDLQQKVGIFTF